MLYSKKGSSGDTQFHLIGSKEVEVENGEKCKWAADYAPDPLKNKQIKIVF